MKKDLQKRKEAVKAMQINKIKVDRKYILSSNSGFYLREAYKALRTNVNFSLADKEGCKTVIVTSAMQSEGKSLTALNLAISLAQTDIKVIIVDCDLRRPKINRLLNVSAPCGLSNVLMESHRLDEAIIKSDEHGVDIILSGDVPPNPSELLASNRMSELLEKLRERYDFIVIDSPPVDLVIDAVVLAPQSDGILFVVRADQSERGAIIHAIEQLEYAKAKVLGFVFNGVNSESGGGYGKYRYKQKGYRRYGYKSRYGYGYGGYGYRGYGYGYGYGYGRSHHHQSQANPTDNGQR